MKQFDKFYNLMIEQYAPQRKVLYYDENGKNWSKDDLKAYYNQLKANGQTEAQTYEDYIDNATSKNGTLTQASDQYTQDQLAHKLGMSYSTWKVAQQLIYLYNESTGWGGRQQSETVNPTGKIADILDEYYSTESYNGNILGGPKPVEYLQLAIYTQKNGAIVALFPDKNDPHDQKIIEDMIKSAPSCKDEIEELLEFWS